MKWEHRKMSVRTLGTKEWAESNVNCYFGCSNNCVYCYAKKIAEHYYRVFPSEKREKMRREDPEKYEKIMKRVGAIYIEDWADMEPNMKAINKGYAKRKGVIMFPTSHDITLDSYIWCFVVLHKLLEAGNKVLITTKPHPEVIKELIFDFSVYKHLIEFRFTITSRDDKILREFEPNAPNFSDRIMCLSTAWDLGFNTSVSIEPFLDKDPIPLVKHVYRYTSGTIWVGKLNYMKTDFNTWDNVQKVVNRLDDLSQNIREKIRLKDSIVNLYKKKGVKLEW